MIFTPRESVSQAVPLDWGAGLAKLKKQQMVSSKEMRQSHQRGTRMALPELTEKTWLDSKGINESSKGYARDSIASITKSHGLDCHSFASIKTDDREPPQEVADNGWQMKHDCVMDRISTLFNNNTMSDLLFQVDGLEIPAHKFILASASPVFYTRFFEKSDENRRKTVVRSRTIAGITDHHGRSTLQVADSDPDAFFEFIRFLYTDQVNMTLDNISSLILLADDYKVGGLSERCLDWLHTQIYPEHVLRVLQIMRTLFTKTIISLWRDVVDTIKRAKETGAPLPPDKMQAEDSRIFLGERQSIFQSIAMRGMKSMATSRGFDVQTKNERMAFKLGQVLKEVEGDCWTCIARKTEKVLVSKYFQALSLKTMKEILSMRSSNVPEICFFRAVNRWAEHQCQESSVPASAENRRGFLTSDLLSLIRFPAMTNDQLLWEVVPTGLLVYEDVAPLLQYKSQYKMALNRFDSHAREGFEGDDLPEARRGTLAPLMSDQKAIYQGVADDPVDAMLSSMFLKKHLRDTSSSDPNGRPKSQDEGAASVRSSYDVSLRKCGHVSYRVMQAVKEKSTLRPEDFERVEPGLYRFKRKRLVKMQMEAGEVIVYDKGPLDPIEGVSKPWSSKASTMPESTSALTSPRHLHVDVDVDMGNLAPKRGMGMPLMALF